jgi:heme-degrading monooxygenase HmoA
MQDKGEDKPRGSSSLSPEEPEMVKVLLERTLKGKHVAEIVLLLRQMRVLAMQQPGYISGETLHAVDDPNHHLVISSWETLSHWQAWFNNPQRQVMQTEIDNYLDSPTLIRVFTY